ncbi:MAG TPA: hypothetical protein DCX07_06180, partial [Phycisphaerales bacterium]|nr:hypothetical protein [Phycisphaerales bacterium]
MNAKRILGMVVMAVVAALAATGLWMSRGRDALLITRDSRPEAVMGTQTHLLAVVEADRDEEADEALQAAEDELRNVELQMSRRIELSDVSKLNAAPAGQLVELSPQTVEVLRASRRLWEQSDGAFDVTIRPLILLWMQAGRDGAPPTAQRLAAAREESRWSDLELHDDGAVKHKATAAVDLGGIAKGYGIDRAVEA